MYMEHFNNDEELAFEAVLHFEQAFDFLSPSLKENKKLTLLAVSKNCENYFQLSEILQNDKELIQVLEKKINSSN